MKIVLTAFATVLGGALALVVGQIIIRGGIEPALNLKRLIGTIAFASVVGHHVWLNAARVRMARLLLEMGEPPFARSEIRPSQQYQADDSAEPDLEEVRWDVTFWVADILEPVVTSEISGHDWIEIYTSCDCSEQFLVVTDEDGEDLLLSVADIDVLCGLEIDRYSSAQLGSLSRVVVYKEV
ncbi:MAG: hypothetical protein H0T92_15525 [Pyrinomonadaceae bacterium]|nr:hypothetical protein [Pyrinomonadaceae bacterium]